MATCGRPLSRRALEPCDDGCPTFAPLAWAGSTICPLLACEPETSAGACASSDQGDDARTISASRTSDAWHGPTRSGRRPCRLICGPGSDIPTAGGRHLCDDPTVSPLRGVQIVAR